jgi:iron-sulfur cluster repair protein YtfE (RIC family)
MNIQSVRTQYLLVAAADHEMLSHAVGNFRRLFAGERPADAVQEFAALRRLLNQKLVDHFRYEDQWVFPALLADQPPAAVVQLIAELRQEHGSLLLEAQALDALLAHATLATCTGELWSALLDFFEDLLKHTVKEDNLFRLEPVTAGG